MDKDWVAVENLLNEPSEQKKDWFDHVCDWLESDHFTARGFRGTVKGIFCMTGIIVCVMLLWTTGHDYFKEFRSFCKE